MAWLRRASEDGFPCYPLFRSDPLLSGLRGDPEFEAFLAEHEAKWERWRATL